MEEVEKFVLHFKEDIPNTIYPIEEVRRRANFLARRLGKDYLIGPITRQIRGFEPLISLMEFSENLELVSQCSGFDKFIEEFYRVKNDPVTRKGWEFELEVANYLIRCGFVLELKPIIKDRTPDMKICHENIFIECKSWLSDNPVKKIENKLYGICYLILKNINDNVDIEVSLNKENVDKDYILKEIKNLLASDKKHFEDRDFSIEIKEGTGKKRQPVYFITPALMESVKTATRYINMWVGNGQTNVRVRAPEFSLTKKIMQIFNGARKQLLKNEANIIVIDFNRFLGKFDDFCKIVAEQFKPNKNTRCSGVLLFEHFINNVLEKAKLSYGATFIHNIHASKPVSKEFTFKIATLGRY